MLCGCNCSIRESTLKFDLSRAIRSVGKGLRLRGEEPDSP